MQLNMEQRRLVQAKPNGHGLIKGVAGSGKTTVAVYRIPFLLNHYCFGKDDRILMVTYNKTLVNYIRYLYEKVDDEHKMDYMSLFGGNEEKIDIDTIDKIMYRYFDEYRKNNDFKYQVLYENNEKYSTIAECIAHLKKQYPKVSVLDYPYASFLLDEIDWIKSCNYMELEEYQNADRLGRMSYQKTHGPQRLAKNSDTRRAIYELMALYNESLRSKGYIDFKDMSLIALKQAAESVERKYTHIIIDESQDLTRVQLEFLKLLYNKKEYSSITFIADTAQSIYPHSWLVKGRSFTSIGFDMSGKSSSLSKNYRTTTQIAQAAYSLIEKDPNIIDDENFVKPSLIDRQGTYPVYKCFKQPKGELEYIADEIQGFLLSRYSYRDIVVIARHKNQLNVAKEYFEQAQIPCNIINRAEADFEGDAVKLLTMHSIKGLEFKVVFIIGLNKGAIPYNSCLDMGEELMQESNDRKLLYVGMTRANELLYLTSSGIPSPFIEEIDCKYLVINPKSKVNRFYDIKLEDYVLKERVSNLYSREEKVRQWVINELTKTYKYPLDLIGVEYKVNCFSSVGLIDVAVFVYNRNNRVPFIFIETKAFGRGIADALSQLKSYMSHSKTCQYGIVTDGNEFVVINNSFERVDDIPAFHTSMLPSSIEQYKYIDVKHHQNYEIVRDAHVPSRITVKGNGQEIEYSNNDLKRLSLYGDIAAGLPIHMNSEVRERFYLPQEWLKGQDDYYMLEILGDSMEGAGIENGDYVVVRKQQTANNRDIVVVAIGEDATLKRWMKMGDTILLIPENERYEPIQVTSEQVNILGLVIGIIKKEG